MAGGARQRPTATLRMPRLNRNGAATRARILDAALTVLGESGLSGFTLQAVAARAGVLYGNLTHHYPTRDHLVEAMLESLIERYRTRFNQLAAEARDRETPVRDIVAWLLDDAMSEETAPLLLQLWGMAAHSPLVAESMRRLYDGAVDAFMQALGLDPRDPAARPLRDATYLMGTVLEGTSSIFWTRDRTGASYAPVRGIALDVLSDLLERRLAEVTARERA